MEASLGCTAGPYLREEKEKGKGSTAALRALELKEATCARVLIPRARGLNTTRRAEAAVEITDPARESRPAEGQRPGPGQDRAGQDSPATVAAAQVWPAGLPPILSSAVLWSPDGSSYINRGPAEEEPVQGLSPGQGQHRSCPCLSIPLHPGRTVRSLSLSFPPGFLCSTFP